MLVVLAHPDDETYGLGGTLAFSSWCGVAVHLLCATGGEAGYMPPELLERYGTAATVRQAELRCASEKLGLASVHLMGYRDSGMLGAPENEHPRALVAAPQDEVAAIITHYMRLLKPHVVLTFDPAGGYRHPDHIAVHRATTQAFHQAGNADIHPRDLPPYQPQKLYYHVFSRAFLRIYVLALLLTGKDPTRFGRNADIDLTVLANDRFPIHAWVDFLPCEAQRTAAVACHASQNVSPTLTQSVVGWLTRALSRGDTYMRAHPPAEPGLREHDLFAGVTID
jgi:LmbE family N-acetylglucosaminyl deacetylase